MRSGREALKLSIYSIAGVAFCLSGALRARADVDAPRVQVDTRTVLTGPTEKVLSSAAEGEVQSPIADRCAAVSDPDLFTRAGPLQIKADRLRQQLAECRKLQGFTGRGPINSMLIDYFSNYQYLQHPSVRRVDLSVLGFDRRAVLALQPVAGPRPLVIIQGGMLSNTTSASVIPAAIGLFDEGPFHFLYVPSVTGSEFQIANQTLLFGGAEEGALLMALARWIRSPDCPWRDRIGSIHLFGYSLGGHSALYVSAYESAARARGEPATFESVIANCPVVNLNRSFNSLNRPELIPQLFNSSVTRAIGKLADKVPLVRQLLDARKRHELPGEGSLFDLLAEAGLRTFGERQLGNFMKRELGITPPLTQKDFWDRNDFRAFAAPGRVPTLLIASDDDPLVRTDENMADLRESLSQGRQPASLGFIQLEGGGHCAFHRAYGWTPLMDSYRRYFLAHSHGEVTTHTERRPLQGFRGLENAYSRIGYDLTGLTFRLKPGSTDARVIAAYKLRRDEPQHGNRLAYLSAQVGRIPLSALLPEEIGVPASDVEAESLGRRLTALVKLKFQGQFGDFAKPVEIEATTFR